MRKQKTKQSMMGISLLAVMGIALLAPGAGMNEVKATSTPSDAETEADAGIEENATASPSDMDMMYAAPTTPVAIDSTNFPDDVFREWVRVNCDKDDNGQLSEDEMLQCSLIEVNNKGIASLTGIEFFPNLTELHCSNNNLNSLDISNNTALTKLYCSNNNLNSLDVSNNTALTSLECPDNNLSNLDLSNNTALTYLYCINNNINNLDMRHNTALTYLACDNNNISSLNVSNNTILKILFCQSNNINSLDVSNNMALTELYCSSNNLNSLDISNNTALTVLYCSNNNLNSLDTSNNTALTYLYCAANNLSNLDVSNNIVLKQLDCTLNNLSSLDLSKNTNLINFDALPTISVPMYKNGDEYYIDLSGLPLDLKRVSIDEATGKIDGTTYNSTSGRINLSDAKDVRDTVRYSYETNAPALSNTKMTVYVRISEVKDITEPTTEEPSTEEPITEQPTTAEPVKVEPAPTQTDNSKDASPKTGDTAPLYPVIFLLLASFVGGVTLYIRRKQQ